MQKKVVRARRVNSAVIYNTAYHKWYCRCRKSEGYSRILAANNQQTFPVAVYNI